MVNGSFVFGMDGDDEPLPGVACRSATPAAAGEEELAIFDRDVAIVTQSSRRPFTDWYFGEH